MKAGVVLLLVLLLLVGALPIAMGASGMEWCPECVFPAGMAIGVMCLAILSLLVIVVPGSSAVLARRSTALRLLLLASLPDKPPRLA